MNPYLREALRDPRPPVMLRQAFLWVYDDLVLGRRSVPREAALAACRWVERRFWRPEGAAWRKACDRGRS